jgi:hypothetical protein
VGKELKEFAEELGIKQTFTETYTPQQNGRAERVIQTIVCIIRALLTQARLPSSYAARTAAYIYNRMPHLSIGNAMPNELFYNRKPDVSFLRPWGCLAYVFNKETQQPPRTNFEGSRKLKECAVQCKFIGYDETKGTFKFLNKQGKTIVSKHAVFLEGKFEWEEDEIGIPTDSQEFTQREHYLLEGIDNPQPAMSISNLINIARPSKMKIEPESFKQAMKRDNAQEWQQAINAEVSALERNETWSLVPKSDEMKLIGSKWVFKYKLDELGNIDRHKARLVAKGYKQCHGMDYKETFAPTTKYLIVKAMLSIAVNNGYNVSSMDVENAYLNVAIDKDIFISKQETLA